MRFAPVKICLLTFLLTSTLQSRVDFISHLQDFLPSKETLSGSHRRYKEVAKYTNRTPTNDRGSFAVLPGDFSSNMRHISAQKQGHFDHSENHLACQENAWQCRELQRVRSHVLDFGISALNLVP